MPKVTKKVMRQWVKELKSIGCNFDMCDGDTAPFANMKTCRNCYVIKDIRYHIDGKPRLPEHPGYAEKNLSKKLWNALHRTDK